MSRSVLFVSLLIENREEVLHAVLVENAVVEAILDDVTQGKRAEWEVSAEGKEHFITEAITFECKCH